MKFLMVSLFKLDFLAISEESSGHTLIHPEDSKKPLKLSKEELGRKTWYYLYDLGHYYILLLLPMPA
jgi:hypothetical protein